MRAKAGHDAQDKDSSADTAAEARLQMFYMQGINLTTLQATCRGKM
jgi:hypothetical protein